MGWVYRKCSKQELIDELLAGEGKVLAHAVRGRILWTVKQIQSTDDGGTSSIFIGCDLLQRDGEWWGYKEMDEAVGPYYYTGPLKFLSLAPERNPVWREEVRKYHAARSRRVSVGQRVALIGCAIPWVRITSAHPLQGEYQGTRFQLERGDLGDLMEEEPDGQNLAVNSKSMNNQSQPGI